jgi:hypothetical protein
MQEALDELTAAEEKSEVLKKFGYSRHFFKEMKNITGESAFYLDASDSRFVISIMVNHACLRAEVMDMFSKLSDKIDTTQKKLEEKPVQQIPINEIQQQAKGSDTVKRLSNRERAILHEIIFGKPISEISKESGITPEAVSYYKKKFELRNLV